MSKILVVQFADEAAVTIPKGASVQVSDGTNVLTNGKVLHIIDALDEPVEYHKHIVAGETGGPVAPEPEPEP